MGRYLRLGHPHSEAVSSGNLDPRRAGAIRCIEPLPLVVVEAVLMSFIVTMTVSEIVLALALG